MKYFLDSVSCFTLRVLMQVYVKIDMEAYDGRAQSALQNIVADSGDEIIMVYYT